MSALVRQPLAHARRVHRRARRLRQSGAAHGRPRPQAPCRSRRCHDEFDWRQGVAWLGFTLQGREFRWPAKIEERWIDPTILSRFVALLDQQDTPLRFTGLDLGGQDCLIGCTTDEQFAALRHRTGLDFEWLG